jgi:hypothetical protein
MYVSHFEHECVYPVIKFYFQPVTTTIVGFILLVINSLVGLMLAVLVVLRMGKLSIVAQTNFRSADTWHQFKAGVPSGTDASGTIPKSRRTPHLMMFIITKLWTLETMGRNSIHEFYDSFFLSLLFYSSRLQTLKRQCFG